MSASKIARSFLLAFILVMHLAVCAGEPIMEEKMEKAPYKVLFSNDTTNILTCTSPYHKKGEPFREDMLEATVDETAGTGVEVHMLQPGMGWIPWWKSKIYPDHYQWFQDKYGVKPNSFGKYMIEGGDMVEVFVDRCRERGLAPFVSLRMNDHHGLEDVGKSTSMAGHCVSRFYEEHPEYRIGPGPNQANSAYQRVHSWAVPEVRAHKFSFIEELCENYDFDGFELDFMRHVSYFQLDKTTSEQRAEIMTNFVAQVRELLDRTAKPDQRRWLCVRIPCRLAGHDPMGIDLPAMMEAGVDMINLSAFYFTEQQTDLPTIRKMVPDAALYLEMTHCTSMGRVLTGKYDNFSFRRTTDEQFYTAAHLVYARGGDGISAFNFVYYREHGSPGRGPFNEPPFHVFNHLGDPMWLAKQPQHYILGNVWNHPPIASRQVPKMVKPGQTATFALDMAPPKGGWKTNGRLRIQSSESLGDSQWTGRFDGSELNPNSDVSEPYPNPYPPLLGSPDEYRAWTVAANLLKDGLHKIEITLVEGKPAEIVFLDLAVE